MKIMKISGIKVMFLVPFVLIKETYLTDLSHEAELSELSESLLVLLMESFIPVFLVFTWKYVN